MEEVGKNRGNFSSKSITNCKKQDEWYVGSESSGRGHFLKFNHKNRCNKLLLGAYTEMVEREKERGERNREGGRKGERSWKISLENKYCIISTENRCLDQPPEQSTHLGKASALLGRFPKPSLLDSTESMVPGRWRTETEIAPER